MATRHDPTGACGAVGVLIVNFGPIPRSGVGDLAVCIADAWCESGSVVYRVDLPGVGDSAGTLPEREEPYFEWLQRGEHADLVAAVAEAIAAEHELRGVVVVGLCSGTWTAVYAAERTEAIVGLALLEPELRVTPAAGTEARRGGISARLAKATSPLAWVRLVFGENRFSSRLGSVRAISYRMFLRVMGSSMPSDTYWPLLASWKEAARKGLPVFVVTSARSWREMYVLRALAWLDRRARGHRITHEAIPGTNHIFAAGGGATRVVRSIVRWAAEAFPSGQSARAKEVAADARS